MIDSNCKRTGEGSISYSSWEKRRIRALFVCCSTKQLTTHRAIVPLRKLCLLPSFLSAFASRESRAAGCSYRALGAASDPVLPDKVIASRTSVITVSSSRERREHFINVYARTVLLSGVIAIADAMTSDSSKQGLMVIWLYYTLAVSFSDAHMCIYGRKGKR